MKFNVIPYFSIILILLIPVNAFADSVNLSVDLPIFTDNDKIVIYGNVSTETLIESPNALRGINKIKIIEKYGITLNFMDISVS